MTVAAAASTVACASTGIVPAAGAQLRPLERDMMVASIQVVAAEFRDTAAVCIEVLGGPDGPTAPGSELLSQLRGTRQAVAAAQCPATYRRMWIPPNDTLGPPPAGYVDPHYVRIGRPQFERPGYAWVYLRLQQGTMGASWICSVEDLREKPVLANCRREQTWID